MAAGRRVCQILVHCVSSVAGFSLHGLSPLVNIGIRRTSGLKSRAG